MIATHSALPAIPCVAENGRGTNCLIKLDIPVDLLQSKGKGA